MTMKIDPRKAKKATGTRPTMTVYPEFQVVNGKLVNIVYAIDVEEYKNAVRHVISKEGKESDGVAIVFAPNDLNDNYAEFNDTVTVENDNGNTVEVDAQFRIVPSWSGLWHGLKTVAILAERILPKQARPENA